MKTPSLLVLALVLAAPARAQLVSPPVQDDVAPEGLAAGLMKGKSMIVSHFAAAKKCAKGNGPVPAKCPPAKPTVIHAAVPRGSFQVVVHQGHAYIHMNSLVQSALTTPTPQVPTTVARINGIAVTSSVNQIKTKADILCAVSASGLNQEEVMNKSDIEAIEALGAKRDPATGQFPPREFLRFELTAPVDQVVLDITPTSPFIFPLTTLLYF